MQAFNNWNVSYSIISFFETALTGHHKVASFARTQDIRFHIEHTDGSVFDALLVNEYSLGLAAVLRAMADFPGIEYVVTGGAWNGYTPEAKEYGLQNAIGIFNTTEFFGALNWTDPKSYYRKDKDGNPEYSFKTP